MDFSFFGLALFFVRGVCSEKHRVAAESLLFQEMNTVELQWKDMSRLEVRCSPPRPLGPRGSVYYLRWHADKQSALPAETSTEKVISHH